MGDLIVNNFYPVEYFGTASVEQSIPADPFAYWASDEQLAPAVETLDFDFGTERPVNFCDFEVCQKPLDIAVFSWDGEQWVEVEPRTDIDSHLEVAYDASATNPWVYAKVYFTAVTTQFIRVQFTRREEPFPFEDSDPFTWSVEVRNLRLIHIIADRSDFIADSGFDIFGNPYRTEITEHGPAAVTDGNSLTYWQSQPNPSKFAVECLYFDVRSSDTDVNSVVIDEVYIEPLTPGIAMHIYTSTDTTEVDWDYKLWEPVPRHYIVRQGHHALPRPTACKFVKLEFSRLTPTPYNVLDYPDAPPVLYRTHPSWVKSEIEQVFPVEVEPERFADPFERVSIDPLALGFQLPKDKMHIDLYPAEVDQGTTSDPLQDFILGTTSEDAAVDDTAQMEDQIQFKPPTLYQADLSTALDRSRAHSRFITNSELVESEEAFLIEDPLVELDPPDTQSVTDLSDAEREKLTPLMWFPRICRHVYQVISSPRPRKIAYHVGIKTVEFTRRNYDPSISYDVPRYLELLEDDENVEYTEFIQDPTAPWRFVP